MSISLHNVSYAALSESTLCQSARWRAISTFGEAPPSGGCYAIYHDSALVYIGSSCQVRTRIGRYFRTPPDRPRRSQDSVFSGARTAKPGVVVTVKVTGSRRRGDWLMREYRLIHRLKPRDNRSIAGNFTSPRMYAKTKGRTP